MLLSPHPMSASERRWLTVNSVLWEVIHHWSGIDPLLPPQKGLTGKIMSSPKRFSAGPYVCKWYCVNHSVLPWHWPLAHANKRMTSLIRGQCVLSIWSGHHSHVIVFEWEYFVWTNCVSSLLELVKMISVWHKSSCFCTTPTNISYIKGIVNLNMVIVYSSL